MENVFVDSNTFHAVESLFRGGKRDPWAKSLAGTLADLFIYADVIRYPIPVHESVDGYDLAQHDTLLHDLYARDSKVFRGQHYSTAQPRRVARQHLTECFTRYSAWAYANRRRLRQFLVLHHSPWIEQRRIATVGGFGYTFSLDDIKNDPRVEALAKKIDIPSEDILYVFDGVLKFPLYGELAGEDGRFLNHPVKDAFQLPTMEYEEGNLPSIPLTFKETFTKLAESVSKDEYTTLLHELRGIVRDSGMHRLGPGLFEKETVREIAASVALPPRLKKAAKAIGAAGVLVGGLGALPILGPAATVLGALISVSALFWEGELPRSAARIKWLRWALKWDIEGQAEKR